MSNAHLARILGGPPIEAPGPEELVRQDAAAPRLEEDLHVPSAELSHWLALVRQQPEIRPEEVARVAQNLADGVYATSTSIEHTAEAILNATE